MMTVDEIIDRLYGLPLAEFTAARNEAARELRTAGQREAAERVKALRRPTAAAGAVNRLVRGHRGEVERFLHTAAELRDTQFSGQGDLGAAKRQEHEELELLTGIGGEAVRQTLLAAAVDDDAAQHLLEARLERELEPRGFGTLLAHAPPVAEAPAAAAASEPTPAGAAAPRPTAVPPESRGAESTEPDDGSALARLQETEAALSAAKAAERDARRRWEVAQGKLEMAQAAVEKAQRDLDLLHDR